MSFFIIFISKVLENILATLRILFISNQKKILGSIINTLIALICLISTITVVRHITTNYLNILAYLLGYFFGTYIGCLIEEKLAMGDNMITCITNSDSNLSNSLQELGYIVTTIDGYGISSNKKVLLITIPRKKRYKLIKLIKLLDTKSSIVCGNISVN